MNAGPIRTRFNHDYVFANAIRYSIPQHCCNDERAKSRGLKFSKPPPGHGANAEILHP
jgi:hypothetical protein